MTTTPPQRIGGWLLGPLAWLLVALLSASLALLLYVMALATPQTFKTLSGQETGNLLLWGISFITAIAMWYYILYPVVDDRILQAQTLRAEALHYLAAGVGVTGG